MIVLQFDGEKIESREITPRELMEWATKLELAVAEEEDLDKRVKLAKQVVLSKHPS